MIHKYLHRLRSSNVVVVIFTLPLPCEYDITWQRPASAADILEYRTRLQPIIVADLAALDGKPHHMRDILALPAAATERQ
jgi:hypothetical protein